MKRLGIALIPLVAIFVGVFYYLYQYRFPYNNLSLPAYWFVEQMGFSRISEPDDFSHYYIDTMDAKGFDKKKVRYSVIHHALRTSKKDSYVNTYALISLTRYARDIDKAIELQKFILDNHLEFDSFCKNPVCGSGHAIASTALEYSRNIKKKGDYKGAFNALRTVVLARKDELKPWVRFGMLEDTYFILRNMTYGKAELGFFDSELSELGGLADDPKLWERYQNLLKWQEGLHDKLKG